MKKPPCNFQLIVYTKINAILYYKYVEYGSCDSIYYYKLWLSKWEGISMKSDVITEANKYQALDIPVPEVGDNDVLIQMKAAGAYGSDFQILYHGNNSCSAPTLVSDYENVGIVTKVGKNVSKIREGDYVAVDLVITCITRKDGHQDT